MTEHMRPSSSVLPLIITMCDQTGRINSANMDSVHGSEFQERSVTLNKQNT